MANKVLVDGINGTNYTVRASGCGMSNVTGLYGQVEWSYDNCSNNPVLYIQVPPKLFVELYVVLKDPTLDFNNRQDIYSTIFQLSDTWPRSSMGWKATLTLGTAPYFSVVFSPTRNIFVEAVTIGINTFSKVPRAVVTVRFAAKNESLRNVLPVVYASNHSGFITTPGFDGLVLTPYPMDIKRTLTVPANHRVMLSFQKLSKYSCYVQLFVMGTNGALQKVGGRADKWTTETLNYPPATCYPMNMSASVFDTRSVVLRFITDLAVPSVKLLFSFHSNDTLPQKLDSGQWNCSVPHYSSFSQHLDCNLDTECEGGEDETGHCPYSSDGCQGLVASRNKCLFYVPSNAFSEDASTSKYAKVSSECEGRGGRMAVIKTREELDDLMSLLHHSKTFHNTYNGNCRLLLGAAYSDMSVINTYRQVWVGADRTVLYNNVPLRLSFQNMSDSAQLFFQTFTMSSSETTLLCSEFRPEMQKPTDYQFFLFSLCELNVKCGAVCEKSLPTVNSLQQKVSFPISLWYVTSVNKAPVYTSCADGHVTHQFLTCDWRSQCRPDRVLDDSKCIFNDLPSTVEESSRPSMKTVGASSSVPMYKCEDGSHRIHYTLVCDLRPDCPDKSDEKFCVHSPCAEFTCSNRQCIPYSKYCNVMSDCLDESDEKDCYTGVIQYDFNVNMLGAVPPVVINLHGNGISWEVMVNGSCPETHYLCVHHSGYCLPVFTRCNGYFDCPDGEDEQGCEDCPGFYRCLNSTVCVHGDHLCDGWPQCPLQDDEWLCEVRPCPAGCLCQGLAFVCSQAFDAHLFPQLRYLDAGGSGMTQGNVTSSIYLIHLILSNCSLQHIPDINLPNLKHLDLSFNHLQHVDMDVFVKVVNLMSLSLAHNPLQKVQGGLSQARHRSPLHVDLSFTSLSQFGSKPFSCFLALRSLNLSYTGLHSISEDGFDHVPMLVNLDMTASPLQVFPADMFRELINLQMVASDNYKLCCGEILPYYVSDDDCVAPRNELSSCKDLLRSEGYRGFLWLVCCLALTGNVFCLVFRCCVHRKATANVFNVFVSSLGLSDCLMGIYIAIIGAADVAFRGSYLYYELDWLDHVACRVAGFLSLLSNEVSALMILLITLDRFLVLRFPFSLVRFDKHSAVVACLVAWAIGFMLAAVPLLPATSHWRFYSQTGICIPLPVTRHEFAGRAYSAGVMIVLNFVLFVFIAVGQAFIYWSVQKNAMSGADTTRKAHDTTVARRLITVAVSDFLCWFPIGLCGLLALAGVPIPGEVSVAMAIFVLPLNSALNPFLYTFNLVMERRGKLQEERLLKAVRAEMDETLKQRDSQQLTR